MSAIKEVIGFLFRYSFIPFLFREFVCRRKVSIIVYHAPSQAQFNKHIKYLAKRFNFISMDNLLEAINSSEQAALPPKSMIITFDDGHKTNINLLSTLRAYRIIPTIYLCSHIVNTNRHFWWETGYPNPISLKKVSDTERLNTLNEVLGYKQELNYKERQSLNLYELKMMLPYVSYGSHSKYHPILTQCADEKAWDEIYYSKKTLEEILGTKIEDFAFPNGNYSAREIEFVKKSGYRSARTLDIGWNDINMDPFQLKVMYFDDDASLNILSARVLGFFPLLRGFKKVLKIFKLFL